MSTEYDNTSLGDISVNNEVIKNISLKAATEVDEVHAIPQGRMGKLWNALTKKGPAGGVKLEFTDSTEVIITLRLMIKYGANIPDAAAAVQENVKKRVEHMTGLTVSEVVVKIIGMCAGEKMPLNEDLKSE